MADKKRNGGQQNKKTTVLLMTANNIKNKTHFFLHRQKVFTPPDIEEGKRRPWGIEQALERLPQFFSGKYSWNISGDGVLARQIMLYHTGPDGSRRIRDQFLHSCEQVMKVLITSVNTQRNNGPLGFLQVRRVSLEDLSELTGFVRSTVIAVVKALTRAGILRTQRRKTTTRTAELVAVRWLTPALFEMLGIGGWIKKQSKRQSGEEPAETETPGRERTRGEKPAAGRMAALYGALENSQGPPGRRRSNQEDKN